ncbi:YbfB/YjiJ family MFS transporter [Aurantimonas endophytica]|uniref:MFS family permease n=1 Tax=Aurantimonas endophytica TaxID=1522175 RepID=A0A7W6HFW4_9HYPH|nr:YbfB/YjiJ family MFS transporter [Aurantimonas endophytica]MBB4004484.1 MFS family permease [Aurantimonas endophytica]MCO6405320.1 YbfB/YjiJ family MFS transporter [Aurantimonas endophytica]
MNPANRLLLGGFLTLAVVMGVGRFLYTPLLPLMQRDYGFGPDIAGIIAAANFAGYLAGSILASFVPAGPARRRALQLGLVASVTTTIGMGLTDDLPAWLVLRGISGLASAFAMIAAAGMIAEALARIGAEARLGWVFGGVGTGIAVSGLLVHTASPALDASGLWIAAGLACLPLVPVIIAEVRDRQLPALSRAPDPRRRVPRPLPFWPLLVNYTCEGLGYSVFATFIVAIVKSRPGLEDMGDWVWIMAGLAGLPSCLVWSRIAERIGFAAALACAYVAQILGVMLPVLSGSAPAALLAALLFGGTFMAITVLTMPLGRHGLGGRGFAVLTAGFGLGQMLGPLVAGFLVAGDADYNVALAASASVLGLGLVALLVAVRLRPSPA